MAIDFDDYELVDEEFEEVPDYPRTLTSVAQLPEFVRNWERDAQARQMGFMQPGSELVTALAGKTGMFDTPADVQRQSDERNKLIESRGEEIPESLKAATAIHSGLRKAAYLPWKVGESLNDITGFSRFMDFIGMPGPEGGYQSNTEKALAYISEEEQKMVRQDEAVHGQAIPYQLLEGTARGLAELPAQFLPAAGARNVQQGLGIASATSGFMGGVGQYAQDRGQGRSTLEALPRAVLSGLITGMTTKAFGATGAESILRSGGLQGIKAKLKNMLVQAGYEAPEEAVDQMGQDILERFDNNPDKPLEATIKDVLMAGAIGGLIGGSVTGARGLLPSARTDQPQDLSGIRLNQGGAQNSKAAEEFHQLQQMEKEGKLDVESAQRLEELKTVSQSGMTITDLDYLEQERQGMRLESTITMGSNPDDPFTGRVMQANFRTGKVEINPYELAEQMKGMDAEDRKAYIKSALSEEKIHLSTPGETADTFIKNATGVEKFLAGWRYTGNVSGRPEAGADISERNLGHEMLRSQIQRMQGITRTELAASVKSGKLTTKILLATEDAIFDIRKALGTSASKEQVATLDAVEKNVKEGLRIASGAEGDDEGPATLRIPGSATAAVNDFAQAVMNPEAKVSNDTTVQTGLGMRSEADLDAMLSLKESIKDNMNALRAEGKALLQVKDFAGAQGPMFKASVLAMKNQAIREAIEVAVNLGSWKEGGRNSYGPRPLDWKNNPAVRKWLQDNGDKVDVKIPEESPAAIRRGGPSKRGQEIAEQKRRIAEMQARARGEELPPELATPAPAKAEPIPAAERVSAEAAGALPRITSKDLEGRAAQVLQGEINIPKDKRPTFNEFSTWARKNMEGVRPDQLRDMWEDRVWGSLLRAEPQRLESWRKALGLESKYGARPIVSIAPEEGFALKDPGDKILARQDQLSAESKQRYRNKIIGAIARRLIGESVEGRASLDRPEVGIDDIAFSNEKTQAGPYVEINRDDLADSKRLNAILRDQARGNSSDPETASRRLVAVVDKAGGVHLVSTYNDAGVQRVTDPARTGLRNKPSRELNKTFLNQYRPFASLLLTDPVKGLRQSFKTVGEFMDKMGKEASERARIGDWEIVPEGPAAEDFQAEGTEGLEGEGGSFMGPGKQTVVPGARAGAMESDAPLTDAEAESVLSHIFDETNELGSPEDVKLSLDGLVAAAASDRLTPSDRMAINGYRKVFDAIEAKNPDMSREEVIDRMAAAIYENYQTSETATEFVRKSLAQFAPQGARPAGPAAEAPRGRELTQLRNVAPTTVRGLQGPTLPAPAAQLGSDTPVRETYIPTVQEEVRQTYDQNFPEEGDLPAALRRTGTVPAPEAILPDTGSPIPRFIPNVNTALTKAMGIERIPLIGRLWGARGKIKDDVDREIVGYSVKRSIGNSQAAILGARMAALNEELGVPFKQDKDGKILNLKVAPGQSQFPSDVFEAWQQQEIVPEKMAASRKFSENEIADYSEKHPRTITLTKEQDKLFREMLKVIEDGYKYLAEKNAKLETYNGESREARERQQVMTGLPKGIEWHAFPRVALYKRSTGPLKTEIRRRIGGSYGVEQERLYKTEAQGQQTTAYEPDMTRRLVAFTQRIYKAVADADMANSETLKGEKPEQRVGKLAKQYEAELRSGEITQRDILDLSKQARLGIEGEISSHPAFSGKIYPIEIAQKLDKAFGEQSHKWVRAAAELSTATKALMLTGDLAQYLQQGGPMMLRHPAMWANATVKSLRSLANPVVTGKYLRNADNYRAATEFIQSGGSLGHLQDFMSGSQPGELATRVPGFRQVVIRSGRAFGTFFDIAKIEMWKGLRETTPKSEWPQVVETIENTVLSGRMESAGMNHARATGERIMLMASAYYRGAINLVAGMAERGVAGSEARKTLASYAGGLTLLMVGSYLAAGMDWEEIRKRLMPGLNNPKFLSYPVKIGGETVEVGPGGIMLNLASLGVDVGMTLKDDPKALASFGMKNPLIKWLTTKLGPIPGFGRKVATGEDVFGNPVKPIPAALEMIQPIPLQKAIKLAGSSNKGAAAVSGAASFVGLAASKYKASNEIYELAQKFIDEEGLRKSTGWKQVQTDDASYTKLRSAVASGSQKRFNEMYERLSETHTDAEIREAMEQWVDRPFTGSDRNESLFIGTLNDHELEIYLKAKEERQDAYANFIEMINEVP